ncbi:uncharacterized protein DDB_G0280315-like [Heptranchias perlo]|uniref:uncharacterized protein DDB_G0280315-like n=1 Tax=Heptranchias perlo TaxID=212740 RepID=UPI00355AAAA9
MCKRLELEEAIQVMREKEHERYEVIQYPALILLFCSSSYIKHCNNNSNLSFLSTISNCNTDLYIHFRDSREHHSTIDNRIYNNLNNCCHFHNNRKYYVNCSIDNYSCWDIFYICTINNYNTNLYIHFRHNKHNRANNYVKHCNNNSNLSFLSTINNCNTDLYIHFRDNSSTNSREHHSTIDNRIHNNFNNRCHFHNNRKYYVNCSYYNYSCWDIFYICTINNDNTNLYIHFRHNKHNSANKYRDLHSAIYIGISTNLNNRDQFNYNRKYYVKHCNNNSNLSFLSTINNCNTDLYIHFRDNSSTNSREHHSTIDNRIHNNFNNRCHFHNNRKYYVNCSYYNYSCWDIFYICTINNDNTNLYIHFRHNKHNSANKYRDLHSAIYIGISTNLNNRDQFNYNRKYYIKHCNNNSNLSFLSTINNCNTDLYIHFRDNSSTNSREHHSTIDNRIHNNFNNRCHFHNNRKYYVNCSYYNYSCWDIFYICTINNCNTNLYIHFRHNKHNSANKYRDLHSTIYIGISTNLNNRDQFNYNRKYYVKHCNNNSNLSFLSTINNCNTDLYIHFRDNSSTNSREHHSTIDNRIHNNFNNRCHFHNNRK